MNALSENWRHGFFTTVKSARVQARVVYALLMRELITRYGRHNIGFAWMFAEPMMFTLGIIVLWSLSHEFNHQHHINMISFAITGYSTILIWRNSIGRCADSIEPNRSLLFHRSVRHIDVFLARVILEICGITLSTTIIFLSFIMLGMIDPPEDLLKMIEGWLLLCWYATAMAVLIGALCEYSDLVDRIWHPLAYFQLPVSGAFIMASWLPPGIRSFVMAFPVPNCVELYRDGYYGDALKTSYDIPYVICVCTVITWIAMFFVRDVSKRSVIK